MAIQTPYTRPETYFFLTSLILIGILVFLIFMPFISTLILAATFAAVIYPLHYKIVLMLKGRRTLASFVTLIGLIVLIIVPLYFIAAQVLTEATSAYYHVVTENSTLVQTIDTLQEQFNALVGNFFPGITIDLRNYLTAASGWLLQNIGTFFSGTISIGLRLVLGLFALYYFIKDGSKFIQLFRDHSPIPKAHVDVLIMKLRLSVRSIIGGSITVAVAQGIVSGIGYAVFGLPNPALLGMLTGISALIPGVGTSLILIPAVIFAFAALGIVQGIGLGIWGFAAVGLLDNFLSPILIGRGLKIHPLVILFSVIGGLTFFGPEGFILGPLAISLFIAMFGIYKLIVKTEEIEKELEVEKQQS